MDKKTTSIIAYFSLIGLLIAICAGDKEGAKFHINQALIIQLVSIASIIPYVGWIVSIFTTVCWILGLVYACKQEEKEVPLIGQFKLLK